MTQGTQGTQAPKETPRVQDPEEPHQSSNPSAESCKHSSTPALLHVFQRSQQARHRLRPLDLALGATAACGCVCVCDPTSKWWPPLTAQCPPPAASQARVVTALSKVCLSPTTLHIPTLIIPIVGSNLVSALVIFASVGRTVRDVATISRYH